MQESGTTLRIRCKRSTFRRFKKVAADFDDYEEALTALLVSFEHFGRVPEIGGRYVVEKAT